jgi:hypothetical protein
MEMNRFTFYVLSFRCDRIRGVLGFMFDVLGQFPLAVHMEARSI